MFRKEEIFYTAFGPSVVSKELPFRIAKSISLSEEHIVFNFIDNAICHDLLGGCPENKVSFLIHAMACWHAQCWGLKSPLFTKNEMNNSPSGVGQNLLPMQKEYLFASKWRVVLDQMTFGMDVSLKEFATRLCCKMENLKLRLIHDIVHDQKVTVILGDYYIENWLFPSDGSKPVLLDWTAWGYGNPMVDLAFFFAVGSNQDVISNHRYWVGQYIRSLLKYNPKIDHSEMSSIQDWLVWALYVNGWCSSVLMKNAER
ncbi:MAG: hypothetical protein SGBAC_010028 [Bacillariaceae sp.]